MYHLSLGLIITRTIHLTLCAKGAINQQYLSTITYYYYYRTLFIVPDSQPDQGIQAIQATNYEDLNTSEYTMIEVPPPDIPKLCQLGFCLDYAR